MFRDNAEVHRLQSLKSFYQFHTEIEEECLQKFHNHCDSALTSLYSNKKANHSKNGEYAFPTPSKIVYFALLDQWALWLDSKTPLIRQCSLENSQRLKESIISSIDEFLQKHEFGDNSNNFEIAKKWIDSPQALLTIGIIQMLHKDGFKEAEDSFNKVLRDGHEFAGEAFYYKACMRMKNFEGLRQTENSLNLKEKKEFKENIDEAIEFFL
jgi:hypothetical protein